MLQTQVLIFIAPSIGMLRRGRNESESGVRLIEEIIRKGGPLDESVENSKRWRLGARRNHRKEICNMKT